MSAERQASMADRKAERHGKQADIIRLYDDASLDLHRLLERKLGNPQEAEEVAQDALEKLCRQAERENIIDLRKFLFTVANRLALNVLRHRGVESSYLAREHNANVGEAFQEYGIDPERVLDGAQRLELAWRAISRLPEKTRRIFLLSRFDGASYPEIAARVGLSRKAVEYHMKRALRSVVAAARASKLGNP